MKLFSMLDVLCPLVILILVIHLSRMENRVKIKKNENKFLESFQKEEKFENNRQEGVTVILFEFSNKITSSLLKNNNIQEIILWNQGKKEMKSMESSHLFTFHSPYDLGSEYGRWVACSMSKTKYCYYQSMEWINPYFKSSFYTFLSNPSLPLILLDPIYYFEYLTFGFLIKYLEFGVFFSKENKKIVKVNPLMTNLFHSKDGKYYKHDLLLKDWTMRSGGGGGGGTRYSTFKKDDGIFFTNAIQNSNHFMQWNKYNDLNIGITFDSNTISKWMEMRIQ
jgi:hypothetical protein